MSDNEQENESEKRETVADIVAEYRNDADAMDRGWLYRPTTEYVRRLLDRIEEAWKREARAIATEHAVLPAVCITKPSGNAAAMREAAVTVYNVLEKIRTFSLHIGDIGHKREFTHLVCLAKNRLDAALSEPPRNCDVGTPEEQEERYLKLKREHIDMLARCPAVGSSFFFPDSLYWAQMPYEAEEGGAK